MELTRNERALHQALDVVCDGLARRCVERAVVTRGDITADYSHTLCPVVDCPSCPDGHCSTMTARKWKEHLLTEQAKGYHGTTEVILFTCPGSNQRLEGDLPSVDCSPD